MKEQPGERAGRPTKDWSSQDGRASTPGLDHPGQETATMQQGPLDWNIWRKETLDWKIGASREEESSPGLQSPGLRKEEGAAAARTSGRSIKANKKKSKGTGRRRWERRRGKVG